MRHGQRFRGALRAYRNRAYGNTPLLIAAIGILLWAESISAQQTPSNITILHTNDIHGSYEPAVATWETDKPRVGGFVALDYYVNQERKNAERCLLLDAGDLMTGTPICDMKYDSAYGGALMAMMNTIGYQGWVFGNHDFDKGADNLRALMKIAKFPIFCANFVKDKQLFASEPYHIYNINGLRVGVIGITYDPMVGMASPEKLDGFVSLDPIQTVNAIVPKIDDQTDLIIVLSHLGIENDRKLAENIKGVDLIVGGHSHTRLDTPEKVNGVLIVQTGSNCRNLGRIDLTVAGDSVMAYNGKLIPLYIKGITPDPQIAALVDSFSAVIDKDYGAVIGQLKNRWENQYRSECNLGEWITDAMRDRMKTDVAFVNSGGLRKSLDAGPITKMDISEILPFDNKIVTFDVTGGELIKIAAHNIGLETDSYQGSLQLSGMTYSWSNHDGQPKVLDLKVNGIPVDPEKIYTATSIDYVAITNADKYFSFSPQNIKQTDLGLTQLVTEAVQKAGVIEGKVDGRIKKLD